jgi:hypothetical protein
MAETTITRPTRHRELVEVEGSRYAVEHVGGGAIGGSLPKHLAEALAEGERNGWHPLLLHGMGAAQVYVVWDKKTG